ncbi:hypothetical protein C8J57DRAFT_1248855 [Mycena rebaudengoi]|nr:hypothetical protein C8J57DRAFT_1248855 [Mycena rebaudengoi]
MWASVMIAEIPLDSLHLGGYSCDTRGTLTNPLALLLRAEFCHRPCELPRALINRAVPGRRNQAEVKNSSFIGAIKTYFPYPSRLGLLVLGGQYGEQSIQGDGVQESFAAVSDWERKIRQGQDESSTFVLSAFHLPHLHIGGRERIATPPVHQSSRLFFVKTGTETWNERRIVRTGKLGQWCKAWQKDAGMRWSESKRWKFTIRGVSAFST